MTTGTSSSSGDGSGGGQTNNNTTSNGKPRTPFWVLFVAGGVAGTVGAVITCPLEVVKTRLQSSKFHIPGNGNGPSLLSFASAVPQNAVPAAALHNPLQLMVRPVRLAAGHVAGTLSALRSVAMQEGVGGLWSGVGATIIGVLPSRAIYFSTYHRGKAVLAESTGLLDSDPRVHLGAACLAGAATCTATNPIWMVKTRMQLQARSGTYTSSLDCLRKIVAEEGIRGLYKGLAASYIGVAESTLQWVIYENLKGRIAVHNSNDADGLSSHWMEYFGAAASAKLIAAIVWYPHEVLRTRMRETDPSGHRQRYRTIRQTVSAVLREEGIAAFYGGMTAHLLRVVPNSAIMFFCYEFLVHTYDRLAVPNNRLLI